MSCALPGEIFEFEIFIDAVDRAFAAQTRLLDAAKGRHFVGDGTGVDPDHPCFQSTSNAPDKFGIARKQIGCKAEFCVICQSHRFIFGMKTNQRRDGAEGFLLTDDHVWSHIR